MAQSSIGRFIVDGYEFDDPDSNLAADGEFAPFLIFDIEQQDYVDVKFDDRTVAQTAADALNCGRSFIRRRIT